MARSTHWFRRSFGNKLLRFILTKRSIGFASGVPALSRSLHKSTKARSPRSILGTDKSSQKVENAKLSQTRARNKW